MELFPTILDLVGDGNAVGGPVAAKSANVCLPASSLGDGSSGALEFAGWEEFLVI